MIDPHQFALFFAAALLLAATPGPGIFYVAARTLSGGCGEGIASSFGNGLGGLVHVVAGAVGVSALVLASAELFTALKFIGAAYLVWLGFRTMLAARRDALAIAAGLEPTPPVGTRRAFREGIVAEALNPKTAAFFLAFLPQFVDVRAGQVAFQFAVLGMLNTLADLVVALIVGRAYAGFGSRPSLVRRLREVSGGAMVVLGLGLLLARRPAS
jgi:threonine/homoserine/homoserine lactone efflux protein